MLRSNVGLYIRAEISHFKNMSQAMVANRKVESPNHVGKKCFSRYVFRHKLKSNFKRAISASLNFKI